MPPSASCAPCAPHGLVRPQHCHLQVECPRHSHAHPLMLSSQHLHASLTSMQLHASRSSAAGLSATLRTWAVCAAGAAVLALAAICPASTRLAAGAAAGRVSVGAAAWDARAGARAEAGDARPHVYLSLAIRAVLTACHAWVHGL